MGENTSENLGHESIGRQRASGKAVYVFITNNLEVTFRKIVVFLSLFVLNLLPRGPLLPVGSFGLKATGTLSHTLFYYQRGLETGRINL